MNKTELNNRIADVMGKPYSHTAEYTAALLQVLGEAMTNDERVAILGFGTFHPIHQSERLARNPRTGEPAVIKQRRSVKFKPGKYLLAQINNRK